MGYDDHCGVMWCSWDIRYGVIVLRWSENDLIGGLSVVIFRYDIYWVLFIMSLFINSFLLNMYVLN